MSGVSNLSSTVTPINPIYTDTATTVDANTADVITIPMGVTPGTYIISVNVAGFEATTPAGVGVEVVGVVRTTGVACVLTGSPDEIYHSETALNAARATIVASGNNAIVQVLGVAGLTINWAASVFSIVKVI